MGIDRQRIVDNFYPPGSEVATHFTPCAIPNGCAGDDWYEYDPAKAKQLLADAGFPNGFDTVLNYRDVVRGYLPDPKVVATDIQAQLKTNLNINAKIEVQESGTFLDNAAAGKLPGSSTSSAGAWTTRTSPTSSTTTSGQAPPSSSGPSATTSPRPSRPVARAPTTTRGSRPTRPPTTPSRHARPDDPDRARRFRRRLPGRRPERPLVSRSGTSTSRS